MEKISRTIDDIFEMSDSRYSLVNAISRKAREIADEAENNNDVLYRKPVNMVIDRLLDGRATIEHIEEEPSAGSPADGLRHAAAMETSVPVYAELADSEDESEENGDDASFDENEEEEDRDSRYDDGDDDEDYPDGEDE